MRQLTERKPRIKISNFFLHGYGETDWRILPTADQDYRKQVTAWDRREFTDARGARRTEWWCPQGQPDHYDSCELHADRLRQRPRPPQRPARSRPAV